MSNSISKKFGFRSLIMFALPTMTMMVLISLYTIVDGIFIARYAGSNSLSAMNIVFPVANVLLAIGIMFSSGASAIIAKNLGEQKSQEARENFSLIMSLAVLIGIVMMVVVAIWAEKLVVFLGATPVLMEDGVTYLKAIMYFAPACMLQLQYQTFFVTAGKPGIGLTLAVIGGISNVVLDYVFMGPLNMGILGAALGTGASQLIPAVFGTVYFFKVKKDLYFVKPKLDIKMIKKSCSNGSSEMVSNLSTAVVTFLFNSVMLKYLGEDGVAAITIALYGQFLFSAIFIGFSMGVAPIFSYNYGLKDIPSLKKIYKICLLFIFICTIIMTVFAMLGSNNVAAIFADEGSRTYEIASYGLFLFSFNYIFAGLNIFASSVFTAYSNGKVSAIISFMRTFVCLVLCIKFLPQIMGVDGVWIAVPVAEALTAVISLYFLTKEKVANGYIK